MFYCFDWFWGLITVMGLLLTYFIKEYWSFTFSSRLEVANYIYNLHNNGYKITVLFKILMLSMSMMLINCHLMKLHPQPKIDQSVLIFILKYQFEFELYLHIKLCWCASWELAGA